MASLTARANKTGTRLGKHDYEWFAEEDLLREVVQPAQVTRLCQNWVNCRREESVIAPADSQSSSVGVSGEVLKEKASAKASAASEGNLRQKKFAACAKCGVRYCSRECQIACWKTGHKKQCQRIKLLKSERSDSTLSQKLDSDTRRKMIQRVIHGFRIYMCPFAVCKYQSIGRGFLLITSIDNPIDSFIYTRPVDRDGRRLDRRIDLEYLDMGEYAELCKSDFELGAVRDGLVSAVDSYDPKTQMVVLWLAACGYLGVVVVPIVPDFGVCKSLGADHAQQRTIQLALDVVDSPGEAEAALEKAAKAQALDLAK